MPGRSHYKETQKSPSHLAYRQYLQCVNRRRRENATGGPVIETEEDEEAEDSDDVIITGERQSK